MLNSAKIILAAGAQKMRYFRKNRGGGETGSTGPFPGSATALAHLKKRFSSQNMTDDVHK